MKMENDDKGLLEFLLRDGVTPSFSFPLDVCEFKVSGLTDENGKGYRPKTWASMGQDRSIPSSSIWPNRLIQNTSV